MPDSTQEDWEHLIPHLEESLGLPTGVLQAVVQTESSGRPTARGKAGERGLMQIEPQTALHYGITNPNDLDNPLTNLTVGGKHLANLYKIYGGNLPKTLAAYNGGPKATPTSTSGSDYVSKVFSHMPDLLGGLDLGTMKEAPPADHGMPVPITPGTGFSGGVPPPGTTPSAPPGFASPGPTLEIPPAVPSGPPGFLSPGPVAEIPSMAPPPTGGSVAAGNTLEIPQQPPLATPPAPLAAGGLLKSATPEKPLPTFNFHNFREAAKTAAIKSGKGIRDFVQPTLDLANRTRHLITAIPHEASRIIGQTAQDTLSSALGPVGSAAMGDATTNASEVLMSIGRPALGQAMNPTFLMKGGIPGARPGPLLKGPEGDEYKRPDFLSSVGQGISTALGEGTAQAGEQPRPPDSPQYEANKQRWLDVFFGGDKPDSTSMPANATDPARQAKARQDAARYKEKQYADEMEKWANAYEKNQNNLVDWGPTFEGLNPAIIARRNAEQQQIKDYIRTEQNKLEDLHDSKKISDAEYQRRSDEIDHKADEMTKLGAASKAELLKQVRQLIKRLRGERESSSRGVLERLGIEGTASAAETDPLAGVDLSGGAAAPKAIDPLAGLPPPPSPLPPTEAAAPLESIPVKDQLNIKFLAGRGDNAPLKRYLTKNGYKVVGEDANTVVFRDKQGNLHSSAAFALFPGAVNALPAIGQGVGAGLGTAAGLELGGLPAAGLEAGGAALGEGIGEAAQQAIYSHYGAGQVDPIQIAKNVAVAGGTQLALGTVIPGVTKSLAGMDVGEQAAAANRAALEAATNKTTETLQNEAAQQATLEQTLGSTGPQAQLRRNLLIQQQEPWHAAPYFKALNNIQERQGELFEKVLKPIASKPAEVIGQGGQPVAVDLAPVVDNIRSRDYAKVGLSRKVEALLDETARGPGKQSYISGQKLLHPSVLAALKQQYGQSSSIGAWMDLRRRWGEIARGGSSTSDIDRTIALEVMDKINDALYDTPHLQNPVDQLALKTARVQYAKFKNVFTPQLTQKVIKARDPVEMANVIFGSKSSPANSRVALNIIDGLKNDPVEMYQLREAYGDKILTGNMKDAKLTLAIHDRNGVLKALYPGRYGNLKDWINTENYAKFGQTRLATPQGQQLYNAAYQQALNTPNGRKLLANIEALKAITPEAAAGKALSEEAKKGIFQSSSIGQLGGYVKRRAAILLFIGYGRSAPTLALGGSMIGFDMLWKFAMRNPKTAEMFYNLSQQFVKAGWPRMVSRSLVDLLATITDEELKQHKIGSDIGLTPNLQEPNVPEHVELNN